MIRSTFRRRLAALVTLLAFASVPALAATTATVTPGDWPLYRGSTIVSRHASLDACVAAAKALNVARTYSCKTSAGVVVAIVPDVCTTPQPAAETQTVQCPAGTTGSWQQSRTYSAAAYPTCWTAGAWTPASAPAGACAPVVTPPANGPKITLNPTTYAVGGYSTLIWSGTLPCTATADPAYAPWSGPKSDYGQSVAPNVSTVFTLTCANGTATAALTVTGSAPPSGGGGGGGTPPPPETLPVPDVLPTPIALPVRPFTAGDPTTAPALKYAETARRNWNFEGHVVPVPFSTDQGYWDYENCTTHYAVWLFDRPSAWFKFAELTGDPQFRDQAVSDFRYWVGKIDSRGFFSCKTGEDDTKYLELQSFLYYEAATGDQQYRPVADRIYAQSAVGFANTYSGSGMWTEREVGIHMGAAVDYYRLTGNTQALARAAALVRQWSTMAGTVGAPLVTETQHEGGGPAPNALTNSPWMSALYFQSARRYWQITGDETVLRQASAYFDWLDVNGLYPAEQAHPEFTGLTFPRYLTDQANAGIGDSFPDESNMLHCPDVAGFVTFAVDAKRRLGLPTARASQRLAELNQCTVRMWANWTRDGGASNALPKYRIQAARAWSWWMRGFYESAR